MGRINNRRNARISKRGFFFDEPTAGFPWVVRVAEEHWLPGFYNPRRGLGNRFIAYVLSGAVRVHARTRHRDAGPGTVVYSVGASPLGTASDTGGEGARLLVLVARGAQADDEAKQWFGEKTAVFHPADGPCVEHLFRMILNLAGKEYRSRSDMAGRILSLLLQFVIEEHAYAGAVQDPAARLYHRCREYLTGHYLTIQSARDVAGHFGITHAWLCRLFRRFGDETPHGFLLQRKMMHAAYELHQHARTVKEVAFELGFADPYSFSKSFKRVMGYSPSGARAQEHDGRGLKAKAKAGE